MLFLEREPADLRCRRILIAISKSPIVNIAQVENDGTTAMMPCALPPAMATGPAPSAPGKSSIVRITRILGTRFTVLSSMVVTRERYD
jgi:hypothetical protein